MKKTNRKSGFTLVELMIVAAIIAILAAIIIPLMAKNRERAIIAEGRSLIGSMLTAAKVQYASVGSWPGTVANLTDTDVATDLKKARYFPITDATSLGTQADQSITLTAGPKAGTSLSGKVLAIDNAGALTFNNVTLTE